MRGRWSAARGRDNLCFQKIEVELELVAALVPALAQRRDQGHDPLLAVNHEPCARLLVDLDSEVSECDRGPQVQSSTTAAACLSDSRARCYRAACVRHRDPIRRHAGSSERGSGPRLRSLKAPRRGRCGLPAERVWEVLPPPSRSTIAHAARIEYSVLVGRLVTSHRGQPVVVLGIRALDDREERFLTAGGSPGRPRRGRSCDDRSRAPA